MRKYFRDVDEDDERLKYRCGTACEDRIHAVGECLQY